MYLDRYLAGSVLTVSRHALYGNGILSGGGPQFARASQETKLLCIALRKILPWSSLENMADDKPSLAEVSSFDSSKLKHVKTVEKNTLPSSESKKTIFFIARHLFCTTKEFLCSSFFEETNDFVLVFELYCVRKELNLVLEALFRRWVSIFYTQRFSEAMTIGECHSVQTPRLASSESFFAELLGLHFNLELRMDISSKICNYFECRSC